MSRLFIRAATLIAGVTLAAQGLLLYATFALLVFTLTLEND